jgi:signal transduction histidine kinase
LVIPCCSGAALSTLRLADDMHRVPLQDGWTGFQGEYAATANTAADLTSILEAVDVPIVVVRRDFLIAGFNKAAAYVFGLSPSDNGRATRDISVLAGLARAEEQFSRAMIDGVESRVDFRDRDKWFVVRISPYAKSDRQVAGAVLTFTNVTAFRASTDQAIYERECTKAILNTVADPLVVLGGDHRIQSGNRAFHTMFRVSRDETQGVPLYKFGNGAFELAPLRMQLEEMLAGGHTFQPVEVDHIIEGKGRRTLVLDAHPLSLPGHRERRVLVTFQDVTARKQAEAANDLLAITERKRSEEELRRSEAFLAEGQRLSSTGSFSWRVTTGEITWSEQLYRIFEFKQGAPLTIEFIGTRVHPEDMPQFNDMVYRARGAHDDFDYEYRLRMPDHSIKYLHVIGHAIHDKDGRLEYIGAAQDVTQRRLSEEALAKTRSELAHVARVTGLGVLTASIAHEVNQPLTAIVTNGESSLHWLTRDEPDIEKVRMLTKRVVADGRRASEIIGRIRDMASQRAPKQKLLSIDDVINESLSFLRHELQEKGIAVSLDLTRGLPQIVGDRTQLQQVIVNLTVNAVQAMTQLAPADRGISVRTMLSDPETVCCSIEDSGPGIDPEHLPRLFDSFFTTKDTGMGMGLAICQSIVEAHGGRIRASNNSAQGGASFSFDLPARHAQ